MNIQSRRAGFAALIAGLALAGGASAAEAVLKVALVKPVNTAIDGRVWACEGDKCTSSGVGDPQSLKRECRRVAAELGALKTYKSENGALDEAGAAACNAK